MPPVVNLVLAIIATLGLVILFMAWLISGLVVRRREPDPPCSPDAFELPFEHITFATRDGVRLAGWLTGEPGRRATVIFCPGMFGSMDGDTELVPMFFEAGLDVLQFDWRAHGRSEAFRGTLGVREVLDVQGAVDFLQSRGVQQIGLMGFSFGGGVALRVAAADQRIACIVCDGASTSVQRAFEGYLRERGIRTRYVAPLVWLILRLVEVRLGLQLSSADPGSSVSAISPRPVFFIHGGSDVLVLPTEQDRLFAACSEPKALWRIEGAGHREGYKLEPEEYSRRVIGFFRQHLQV
jgi:fermentation-respiration switch protein FrsA (DUF1100 family)